jgi:hypothetical protein
MTGGFGRAVAPWLPALSPRARAERVRALTGVSRDRWQRLAAIYSGLPEDPGPLAARQRRDLGRRASRALGSGRWNLLLDGPAPDPAPCVYVTGHIGSLQVLRYALRARGIPAATVLGPHNRDRAAAAAQDRVFDRKHGLPFPHALASSEVHRLRSALKQGSLIAAADLPEHDGVTFRLLGGPLSVDPRPFRLARAAGVPCRAAFATLPSGRWTLTIGPVLAGDDAAACAAFARAFAEAAVKSPTDLDGVVYGNLHLPS